MDTFGQSFTSVIGQIENIIEPSCHSAESRCLLLLSQSYQLFFYSLSLSLSLSLVHNLSSSDKHSASLKHSLIAYLLHLVHTFYFISLYITFSSTHSLFLSLYKFLSYYITFYVYFYISISISISLFLFLYLDFYFYLFIFIFLYLSPSFYIPLSLSLSL